MTKNVIVAPVASSVTAIGLPVASNDMRSCSTMRGRIKGADSTINAIPRTVFW